MAETEDKSKPKEKRIEEKEKLDAEVERSFAAARVKEAHKKIEDVEKKRKHSALLSICNRIDTALVSLKAMAEPLSQFSGIAVGEPTLVIILHGEQTYDSIRTDVQKVLEIRDEDMQKLFPKIELRKGVAGVMCSSLICMMSQLRDMRIYCERMLT